MAQIVHALITQAAVSSALAHGTPRRRRLVSLCSRAVRGPPLAPAVSALAPTPPMAAAWHASPSPAIARAVPHLAAAPGPCALTAALPARLVSPRCLLCCRLLQAPHVTRVAAAACSHASSIGTCPAIHGALAGHASAARSAPCACPASSSPAPLSSPVSFLHPPLAAPQSRRAAPLTCHATAAQYSVSNAACTLLSASPPSLAGWCARPRCFLCLARSLAARLLPLSSSSLPRARRLAASLRSARLLAALALPPPWRPFSFLAAVTSSSVAMNPLLAGLPPAIGCAPATASASILPAAIPILLHGTHSCPLPLPPHSATGPTRPPSCGASPFPPPPSLLPPRPSRWSPLRASGPARPLGVGLCPASLVQTREASKDPAR